MKLSTSMVCRITLLAAVGGALALGCGEGNPSSEELGEHRELIVVGQQTLTLTLPRTVSPADVGLAATGSLRIDDRAQINGVSGLATISNTGPSGTNVGVDARAGNVWSASQVTLRDRSQISGFITTASTVVRGNSVTVAGPISQGATLTPSNVVNVSVVVPSTNAGSRTIEAGQSFTPTAQRAYESLTVRSNGTLTLRTGTYYLGSLVVDPGARVVLDNTSGPVFVYVTDQLIYRSAFVDNAGQGTGLFLGYLGTGTVMLEAPFRGTLAAPRASLGIGSAGAPGHTGAFFAKDLEVFPGVVFTERPFDWTFVDRDSDCDGIGDQLEVARGLNPQHAADGRADPDGDGVPNADELLFEGNPFNPDTDGDGIGDESDLLTGRDLDGDGRRTELDNCPEIVNASQSDVDGDGSGDVCDSTPLGGDDVISLKSLFVARAVGAGPHALLAAGRVDASRALVDQRGLVPTGTTFLALDGAVPGMNQVRELWNPTTGAHAYVTSSAEEQQLVGLGYRSLGVIGSLAPAALPFGQSVRVRRFVRAAAPRREAVTTSAQEANQLLAAGYQEVASLGFGLVDGGRVKNPRQVVRYRRASDGATVHSLARGADAIITGFDTDGARFAVFQQKSGWTVPLYRLRNAAGREALSTDAADRNALVQAGFVLEGVIGYVYPMTTVDTKERLVTLTRMTATGKPDVVAASQQEITQFRSQGYSVSRVLGRAVAIAPSLARGSSCVGQPTISERLDRILPADSPPLARSVALASALTTACTITRILNGQIVSQNERQLAPLMDRLDPETRAELLRVHGQALAIPPAERALLLGPLAFLDPGTCSQPVDVERLAGALERVSAAFDVSVGPGAVDCRQGNLCHSLSLMRAPQCGGVTYDPADPVAPGTGARAITAIDRLPDTCRPDEEFCQLGDVGRIRPVLFGVRRTGPEDTATISLPPGQSADLYAEEHQRTGLPLIGVDVGPCTSACTSALGRACVENRCRSYPIVENGTNMNLSGASLWDLVNGEVRFSSLDQAVPTPQAFQNASLVREYRAFVEVRPLEDPVNRTARCDGFAVRQARGIHASNDPCICSGPGPCPGCVQGVGPNENFTDIATVDLPDPGATSGLPPLDSDKFYFVQFVNQNGNYYRLGDEIPFDPAEFRNTGRTVHVCTGPRCGVVPDSTQAACQLVNLPSCGGSVGGTWTTPPRSLDICGIPGGLSCEETPREFASLAFAQDRNPFRGDVGLPTLVFVRSPSRQTYIQTKLQAVSCFDETGWDRLGDDELVVNFISVSGDLMPGVNPQGEKELDIGDLERGFGTLHADMNSGGEWDAQRIVGSIPGRLNSKANAMFLIQLGENDDTSFLIIATTVVGAAAGAVTGGATAGPWGAAGGGVTAGMAAYYAATRLFDPDDFLGQAAWQATAGGVAARGVLSHDGRSAARLDCIESNTTNCSVPLVSAFPPIGENKNSNLKEVAQHPAVDATFDHSNGDLISCAQDSACGANQRCFLGACVFTTWTDATLPKNFTPATDAPGTIEVRDFTGSGAHYRAYIAISVSGRDERDE